MMHPRLSHDTVRAILLYIAVTLFVAFLVVRARADCLSPITSLNSVLVNPCATIRCFAGQPIGLGVMPQRVPDGSFVYDMRGCERYEWRFGDGGTESAQEVRHTYERAGTYRVVVKVSGEHESWLTEEVRIEERNK